MNPASMKPVSRARANCPIARSLDSFGDRWSLLILRECFSGVTRFDDFQKNLKVSKNTLTARLGTLVKRGILKRVPIEEGARRKHYKLTPKGKELYVIFIALRQWGDKWTFDGKPPNAVIERANGRIVAPVEVRSVDGRTLQPRDTVLVRL
jgi:DNA-binding HxlR family transcriptional regulator